LGKNRGGVEKARPEKKKKKKEKAITNTWLAKTRRRVFPKKEGWGGIKGKRDKGNHFFSPSTAGKGKEKPWYSVGKGEGKGGKCPHFLEKNKPKPVPRKKSARRTDERGIRRKKTGKKASKNKRERRKGKKREKIPLFLGNWLGTKRSQQKGLGEPFTIFAGDSGEKERLERNPKKGHGFFVMGKKVLTRTGRMRRRQATKRDAFLWEVDFLEQKPMFPVSREKIRWKGGAGK